jgi:hypothetical protein
MTESMVGAATGRHREIRKHDGSSGNFAKSKGKNKSQSPGEKGKRKRRNRVIADVRLDNPQGCYRQDDSSISFANL